MRLPKVRFDWVGDFASATKSTIALIAAASLVPACTSLTAAETTEAALPDASSVYDAQLAADLNADEYGMKSYVFVLLKTGPAEITEPERRSELFAGHFANMSRLSEEGKLVLAGPFVEAGDNRGLFILNTDNIEEARQWTESDPAIAAGIFAPEFSKYYGSATLQQLKDLHAKVQKTSIN